MFLNTEKKACIFPVLIVLWKKAGQNKTTSELKEAFNKLLNTNTRNLSKWLERVAIEDPGKAIELVIKMAAFVIPKLQRSNFEVDMEQPFKIIFPNQNVLESSELKGRIEKEKEEEKD